MTDYTSFKNQQIDQESSYTKLMPAYTSITIIFNPNSTGNGKQLAEELKAKLLEKDSKLPIKMTPTKHAGHAESLAYELAKATKKPLIISASGDGGYHEVINGIMRANQAGAQAMAGLLPAGNANDHYNNLHNTDITKAILNQTEKRIDLLTLKTTSGNKPLERYAHSYIGIGLTSKAGKELNKNKLNRFNEIIIVLRVLFLMRPTRISIDGKVRSYDSVIFSNIDKMSKVLKLSEDASPQDGKFEVIAFRRRSKFRLIKALIKSSTLGLKGAKQVSQYKFKTLGSISVQLDGEITKIDADSDVIVGVKPKAISCIV